MLESLRGGRPAFGAPDASQSEPRLPGDEIEQALRGFGYDRLERERLRRGRSQSRGGARHRGVTVKRYQYNISRRCPDLPTAIDSDPGSWRPA